MLAGCASRKCAAERRSPRMLDRTPCGLSAVLDFAPASGYKANHLVFGKAVRIRHYPVTVSAEN